MIVYAVEQRAAAMEGPEGQRGLFTTREAAEQHKADLVALDPAAFASREDADAAEENDANGAGSYLDHYYLDVVELSVDEAAPKLVAVYSVYASGIEHWAEMLKYFSLAQMDRHIDLALRTEIYYVEHESRPVPEAVEIRDDGYIVGTDREQVWTTALAAKADLDAQTDAVLGEHDELVQKVLALEEDLDAARKAKIRDRVKLDSIDADLYTARQELGKAVLTGASPATLSKIAADLGGRS